MLQRPKNQKRRRPVSPLDPLLLLILLGALALRLWGIADRLPDPRAADVPREDTAVDEGDRRAMQYAWEMWYGGTRALNLNPGTGDWPGLPFYLTLGSQVAYRAYDLVRHPGMGAASFAQRVEERPMEIFLASRLVGVVLGVLSVFLVFRLGSLVGGRGLGLVASGFLAVMPFHVFSSQRISDPNLLSLVLMTAASIAMLRLRATSAMRDSVLAGAWIGLAGACKYLPLILVVPLALAHVGARKEGKGLRFSIGWRPLAAGLATALLVFALASPYTLLDWRAKQQDMRWQQERLMAEWAGISSHSRALPTYVTETLPGMMTWPGYLLAVAGCVLLWRRGRDEKILVLVPLLFVSGVGTMGLAQPRFVFPAMGVLAVACATSAISIGDALARRMSPEGPVSRSGAAIPALFVAGIAAWGLIAAAETRRVMAMPDSRHVARDWVLRSIGENERMALDAYGPVLKRGAEGRRVVAWPFNPSHIDIVQTAFHPEWLDGLRYYMTSSEVTRRFAGMDARYAAEYEFYAWIRQNGAKVWSSDSAAAFGPRIDLYELPRSISTREARDSIWAVERRSHRQGGRIARWASDLAEDFLLSRDPAKAEEWARRGLEIRSRESQPSLLETLALALLQQGKAAEAEATAREGMRLDPLTPLFHVLRAMALESLGRTGEAIEEYRLAMPLSPNEDARAFVNGAIARLEAGAGTTP